MGHGHFDKLAYSLYDEVGEVAQDYGAARWVNIDQKGGGRYLPENDTWAKQSIAHNTLVVNETSHYNGDIKIGENFHPDLYHFNGKGNVQIVSAKTDNAYPGSLLHRTVLLIKLNEFEQPLMADIFKVESATNSQYDLPLWYGGHLLQTNIKYDKANTALTPLGDSAGYQFIWKEGAGHATGNNAKLTWFGNGKFYSLTAVTGKEDDLIFGRLGANDPQFNLRHDPAFIIRKKDRKNALFVSLIEPHGEYNPVEEIANNPYPSIAEVAVLHNDTNYTLVRFSHKSGKKWVLMLANTNASETAKHTVTVDNKTIRMDGRGFAPAGIKNFSP